MDDRIWCQKCGKWASVKILEDLPSEDEKNENGQVVVWVLRMKCKCVNCGHVWIEVMKWC